MVDQADLGQYVTYPIDIVKFKKGQTPDPEDNNALWNITYDQTNPQPSWLGNMEDLEEFDATYAYNEDKCVWTDLCPTSHVPSASPLYEPTSLPSLSPSEEPSMFPSSSPSPSDEPSATPSDDPSTIPSASPSDEPSTTPSALPSVEPSHIPSASPSNEPSLIPSASPSKEPSVFPSSSPSSSPSDEPSGSLCTEDDDCNNGCCVRRCISNTANQCVLKSLYDATNGDMWTENTGWDFEIVSDPCASGSSWFGISCREDDITFIRLCESSSSVTCVCSLHIDIVSLLFLSLSSHASPLLFSNLLSCI